MTNGFVNRSLDIPPGFYLRDGQPMMTWFAALELLLLNDRPIRILSPVCDSNRCLELARFVTHWPGQDGVKCEGCTSRARSIADVMGFALQTTELPLPLAFARDDAEVRFSLMELT